MVGAAADPGVLAELVAWRKALARASGVPANVIFPDATLAAVAEARPTNRDALMALPGLGPLKVGRYGDELLALVARVSA
jgi:DNA helicase-2/ATP-dependent DNA helicase PcrA